MVTKIEWCDETWNPVMGCTPISDGCKNCYARSMMNRFACRPGWPESPDEVTLFPDRLEQPFKWKKPKRIFVCSMGDLFHEDVPFDFISAVFDVIKNNPQHVFQVLTKRPRTARLFLDPNLRSDVFKHWPFENVHIGVSVENQPTADERIPLLIQTPAAKRFVSYEPALGPVDFSHYTYCTGCGYTEMDKGIHLDHYLCREPSETIDQIICGAETGPGARPIDLDWARSVRDQCQAAGTAFFFKKDSEGNRELDGKMWEEMI